MSRPNDAIDLTVVYEDAGAGRLTASIPAVPGTISWGRTQAEARPTGAASDQADGASGNPAERGDERLARLVEACEIIGVPRAPA
jgi:hypothetical protein